MCRLLNIKRLTAGLSEWSSHGNPALNKNTPLYQPWWLWQDNALRSLTQRVEYICWCIWWDGWVMLGGACLELAIWKKGVYVCWVASKGVDCASHLLFFLPAIVSLPSFTGTQGGSTTTHHPRFWILNEDIGDRMWMELMCEVIFPRRKVPRSGYWVPQHHLGFCPSQGLAFEYFLSFCELLQHLSSSYNLQLSQNLSCLQPKNCIN